MKIKALNCGIIGTNTFFIIEGDKMIIIDPAEYTPIRAMIDIEGVSPVAILLTHGHFDHITAVAKLKSEGIPVYAHSADVAKCEGTAMSDRIKTHNIQTFTPDILLVGGEILEMANLKIEVIHTPGHSGGSVCYKVGDAIFCGDTIFEGCYGRYDFYDGSLSQIKKSIAKIFALDGDYDLYCGHGNPSKLSIERVRNAILWS